MKIFLLYIYFISIFSVGIIQALKLPSDIYWIISNTSLYFLFTYDVIDNKKAKYYPYFFTIVLFIFISLISYVFNGGPFLLYIKFLATVLNPYIMFLIFINIKRKWMRQRIIKFILLLFLLQLPVMFLRYFYVGQREGGLSGTVGYSAGSISAILPVFAISYLISYWILGYRSKRLMLFLSICYFLYGIIGDKRIIVGFIPITVIVIYIYYLYKNKSLFKQKNIAKLFLIFCLSFTTFYLGVRMLPSLNPDKRVWGRFDIEYFIEYSTEYSTAGDANSRDIHELQRLEGLKYFTKYMINSDYFTLSFGEGPGKIMQSKYFETGKSMLESYGVRYGGRMGFIWMLMQVGFAGTLLYIFLFLLMLRFAIKTYTGDVYSLSYIGMSFVFFIDYFYYSDVFLKSHAITSTYFLIFGIIWLERKSKLNNDTIF